VHAKLDPKLVNEKMLSTYLVTYVYTVLKSFNTNLQKLDCHNIVINFKLLIILFCWVVK
jgi:hypothetical protein